MRLPSDVLAVARLEIAEVVRSRWLFVCLGLYAVLAAIFVLVGLSESSVVGFTGMGRVFFSLCHAIVLLLPLVALAVTGQVINRARDDGALEFWMSQPVSRSGYFTAVTIVRYLTLALPLVALLVDSGQGVVKLVVGLNPPAEPFAAIAEYLCEAGCSRVEHRSGPVSP